MARLGLPPLHWSIGGQPVILADWSGNSSVGSGFDQMRGVISTHDVRLMPETIMQGSIIQGWSEYGQVVYEGRLAATPKIAQDGSATIVAQGRVSEARKRQSRLLFYTNKGSIFQDPTLAPFNRPLIYTGDPGVKIPLVTTDNETGVSDIPSVIVDAIGKGSLSWTLDAAYIASHSVTSVTLEALLYVPEGRLRRLRGYGGFSGTGGSFQIRTIEAPLAPAITVANITTDETGNGWGSGYQGWFDATLPGDGASGFIIAANVPSSPGTESPSITIWGLEVWGEVEGDLIYSDQAAASIADRLDWDASGVEVIGGVDVRPLDWIGAWDEMIAYVAQMDSACWGVYEDERGYGPRLDFGPYGRRTWQVSSTGASWDLEPLEMANRVVVAYVTPDGNDAQFILDADPDPLESLGLINEVRANMNDRQAGYDLAARLATSTLRLVTRQLYAGKVTCVSAMDTKTGLDAPYEIRAGDLLTITDFNDTEPLTVQIADVEYSPGQVSIGVNEDAVPLPASASGVTTRVPPSAPATERNDKPTESSHQGIEGMRVFVHNHWDTGWGGTGPR